jgi:hypothetical protein
MMSAPANPKATPRSSERFKEVVAQLLPHVLFTFFVEDIVAQPCLRQALWLGAVVSSGQPSIENLGLVLHRLPFAVSKNP